MKIASFSFKLAANFFSLTLLAFIAAAELSPVDFNFPSFNGLENDGTINVANATDAPGDGIFVINIPNKLNTLRTGWVVHQDKAQLWDKSTGGVASFSTSFTFSITAANATVGGSGLAFFLAPEFSIGDIRGYLGVFSEANDGNVINRKVAVEFDVFKNVWDPSSSHVGLDINSIKSVKVRDYCPANDIYCTYFINKGDINVWIDYAAETLTLEVRLAVGASSVRPVEPILQHVGLYLPNVTNEFMVVGFSASTGSDTYPAHAFRLSRWHFKTMVPSNKKKTNLAVIAGVSGSVVFCVLVICIVLFLKRKDLKNCGRAQRFDDPYKDLDLEILANGPQRFTYKELSNATKGFSEREVLGRGGFGKVFRGVLKGSGTMVAVKKISENSKQGLKEFVAEVSIISKIRHRNLVPLQGWCHERGQLILVYDYMPNGSLDQHLYSDSELLTWDVRYNIISNVASALAYLHEEWEKCVIHRDVKSSNVMLDNEFNGRLGDFGLAKLVAHDKVAETTMMAGTLGYMAPELSHTGKSTTMTDVYSFGILALEVICGRRPFDQNNILLEWVWENHEQGNLLDVVDSRFDQHFNPIHAEVALSLALMCTHPNPGERPNMQLVRQILVGDVECPHLPSLRPYIPYSSANSEQGSNHTSRFHSVVNSATGGTGNARNSNHREVTPR